MSFGLMQFADFAGFVRSRGVEVSKTGEAQTVSPSVSLERIFEEKLSHPIRVDGHSRIVFCDRNFLRNAIDRARRREDELEHVAVDAGIQERQGGLHIVLKIFSRIFHRLAYVSVGGE